MSCEIFPHINLLACCRFVVNTKICMLREHTVLYLKMMGERYKNKQNSSSLGKVAKCDHILDIFAALVILVDLHSECFHEGVDV